MTPECHDNLNRPSLCRRRRRVQFAGYRTSIFISCVIALLTSLKVVVSVDDSTREDESFDEAAVIDKTVVVETALGKVQGIRQAGIDFFGGIPYAEPPVGNLRWAPPEEPVKWRPHTLDATRFGPDCWQLIDSVRNPVADESQMSEDCLYLNIFTPAGHASRKKRLPVLLWFHGGGFQQGAARRQEFEGRRLAERDVIVVTINYRLGSLGFLVSSPDGITGNFGLMDQRAAMYWIQSHIESFGGDPDNVTLFGESAGAVMIGLHLHMENKSGLFHKAIMQSNPLGYRFRSVVVADFLGETFKRALECKDLRCLRNEPAHEIMRAQQSLIGLPRSVGDFFTWGPTLTSELKLTIGVDSSASGITSDDLSSFKNLEDRRLFRVESHPRGTSFSANRRKRRQVDKFSVNVSQPLDYLSQVPHDIPVIVGSNRHEGEMFVHSAFPLTMSKPVYWMFVGALFKDSARKVLRHYRPYVDQVELEAQMLAEKQIEEEENKQFYFEHREAFGQERKVLLSLNATRNANGLISQESFERILHTEQGGNGDKNYLKDAPNITRQSKRDLMASWSRRRLPRGVDQLGEKEQRHHDRLREKALKEAAKVVVDYRPVMSRIITDYLFRCPGWHYAHELSKIRGSSGTGENVYVYRFSQPTHIPGYDECWGKSCHTSEVPYVFQSMDLIRSNYSTLSPFAQEEAPSAPDYPFSEILEAIQKLSEVVPDEMYKDGTVDTGVQDQLKFNVTTKSHSRRHPRKFQRILKHFFGDYFLVDADEELASDMADRWVSFAKTGQPNFDEARVEWVPWMTSPVAEESDEPPIEKSIVFENIFDGGYDLDDDSSHNEEESRRRRQVLEALDLTVVEDDPLHTELKHKPAKERDEKDREEWLAMKLFNAFQIRRQKNQKNGSLRRKEIQDILRIAQDMGILGKGIGVVEGDLDVEEQSSGIPPDIGSGSLPQLLELKWPPEGRLVERDCTCDFWEKIRYKH